MIGRYGTFIVLGLLVVVILITGCDNPRAQSPSISKHPPVTGPVPSTSIAAFYYPWYGNPEVDGRWMHWQDGVPEKTFQPPEDISSDYYPLVGVYSSADSSIVAQHMAWLRQARVGLIIISWWGKDAPYNLSIPKILDEANYYGLKVAFMIEPYRGRSASTLADDISYLYDQYGTHPAFFWTIETSTYVTNSAPKGLFFIFLANRDWQQGTEVSYSYWLDSLEQIHMSRQSSIVLAYPSNPDWVNVGHFDGLFNYATLDKSISGFNFDWAWSLPAGAWYVPGVLPGYVDTRIRAPKDQKLTRNQGTTYIEQWEDALSTGIKPRLITITSWNEWHEGTQIEPAASSVENGSGFMYLDYGPLGPEGYLELTRQMVMRFEAMTWPAFGTGKAMVSVILGPSNTEYGLRQMQNVGDGQTEGTYLSEKPCRLTVSHGVAERYMYFNAQSDFVFAKPTNVIVTVEYLDAGTNWFALQYDSSDFSASPLEGRFKRTESVVLHDSGTWKTATFHLPDAYFGNRQHNSISDFRIEVVNQDMAISKVTVER